MDWADTSDRAKAERAAERAAEALGAAMDEEEVYSSVAGAGAGAGAAGAEEGRARAAGPLSKSIVYSLLNCPRSAVFISCFTTTHLLKYFKRPHMRINSFSSNNNNNKGLS